MKPFILLLTFFAFTSCSTNAKKSKIPNPTAVALNDSAVAIMMKFKSGNLDSAHILLDKSVGIDPDYFIAYSNKVSVYCRQMNFKKAAETARNLERIQPENPEGIFALGFLLEKSGQLKEAEKKYKKALSINENKLKNLDSKDKNYLSVQTNYALNLIFAHKEEQGRRELNKILAVDSENRPARMLYNKDRNEILNQLTSRN